MDFPVGGEEYYYIRNGQNDIIGILDSSGNQVVSYVYDSWGKLISIDGTLKDTIGVENPFRYRGYYYDTELGLYYLNSRYYDPEYGRFLNADAISDYNASLLAYNQFVYCANNPVNNMDPNGKSLMSIVENIAMTLWDGLKNFVWGLPGTIIANAFNRALAESNLISNSKVQVPSGPIYGQHEEPVASMGLGFVDISHGGCGVVATYNALQIKGKKVSLPELIYKFEISGATNYYGALGTNFTGMTGIWSEYGLSYQSIDGVDQMDKQGIYIVEYFNSDNIFDGIHYATVVHYGAEYTGYNLYNDSTGTDEFPINDVRNRFINGYYIS